MLPWLDFPASHQAFFKKDEMLEMSTCLFVYSFWELRNEAADDLRDATLIIDEDAEEKREQQGRHSSLESANLNLDRLIDLLLLFDLLLKIEHLALLLLHDVLLRLVHVGHAQLAEQLFLLLLGLLSSSKHGLLLRLLSIGLFLFSAHGLLDEISGLTGRATHIILSSNIRLLLRLNLPHGAR